jgi:hypothetical protein
MEGTYHLLWSTEINYEEIISSAVRRCKYFSQQWYMQEQIHMSTFQ